LSESDIDSFIFRHVFNRIADQFTDHTLQFPASALRIANRSLPFHAIHASIKSGHDAPLPLINRRFPLMRFRNGITVSPQTIHSIMLNYDERSIET
jgi:hypothetical protein